MCSKTGVAASTANHEGEQAEGGPLCWTSLDLSLAVSFLQRRDQRKIKGMDSDMSLSPPDEAMPVSQKRAASSMEKPEPKKAKAEPEPKADPENEIFIIRVRGRRRWKIFQHLNDVMETQDKIIQELKTQK
ncbi:uncharacterized protein ACNLHF_009134 [Anomaloglossus baeobatrachus]